MMSISLVFLLLIIVQGVVIGPPVNPSPNLKTLVSRSPDGGGGGKPTPGNPGHATTATQATLGRIIGSFSLMIESLLHLPSVLHK
ncbi:hypothetical protein KEM48_009660 [Puccinia striiformis f. sp. tritici PST-130]|nr:hypothetical protein KEM48_009660 [Puccinia striiformis f. sp. tritici PST-130]